MKTNAAPVLTIDGPSGAGKGTVARLVARELGWHFLDSGALYRLIGLAAQRHAIPLDNAAGLEALAAHLDVQFQSEGEHIIFEGEEVTWALRTEECGNAASQVAALPTVRAALLERQRAFREPPGLVADGRDMGTVVFPDAPLKVFLTASREERATRRYKQLKDKGFNVNLNDLIDELARRDARDSGRHIAPLKAAQDAVVIDSTHLSISAVVSHIILVWSVRSSQIS